MKTIYVKTGESVSELIHTKYTPSQEVINANILINDLLYSNDNNRTVSTNVPDYVSAIYHIGKHKGIDVKLYVDDFETTIEGVFEEFNKCYDLLNIYSEE
jgi:hypothetical protein